MIIQRMNLPAPQSAAPPAPDAPTAAEADRIEGICLLPQLGVIQATGEDAAKFLHGQLTQDFLGLAPAEAPQARLAALCNAKGRMQASFVALRRGEDILLVCSQDLLAAMVKRLSMFVLRAKVRLTDASAVFDVYGLAGSTVADNAGDAAMAPWTLREVAGASIVGLYPGAQGLPRALWIAPAGSAVPAGEPLAPALWDWAEVTSGVAMLTQPVAEAFVPQMLNYESVGGVSFKKGCYPGQEVVARSQFRGILKRRAYLVHASVALAAGDPVFHRPEDAAAPLDEPCGIVVQAAPAPGGGFDAIVSMQVAAAQGGVLTAGAADGAALVLRPLPYELLADV